jgi:predicted DNA binding CopG/RHH family protein
MNQVFPRVNTDEEIEALLEGDMSQYANPSNWKKVTFEFQPKDKTINLRMSEKMLDQVKLASKKEGIPYQRYIRQSIERSLSAEY